MAPTKMTLTYFDLAGLAEPVRMALSMTGLPWEDNRLTHAEFADLKPSLPNGQVPVLEVDGAVLPQSEAQLRFAGKLAGLYPEDELEAAFADAAVYTVADVNPKLAEVFREKDPAKKLELGKNLAEGYLLAWLANMEKALNSAGGKYFAGNKLSIGDIAVVARLRWLTDGTLVRGDGIPTAPLDKFPLLSALVERVSAEPRIATYLCSTTK